jgi:hypothetical protein
MATSSNVIFLRLKITQFAKNVVVAGEIVILKNGKVDFHALQERGHIISINDLEKLQ